jgi:hypothetical protein
MEFCPICYKQTEKEIWKKESRFREIRWVFCPNHGYIKDDQQRPSLRLKIEAAKKRRIQSAASRKAAAAHEKHVFLLGKCLIMSVLVIVVTLCSVLGYFVGVQANRQASMKHPVSKGYKNQTLCASSSKNCLADAYRAALR